MRASLTSGFHKSGVFLRRLFGFYLLNLSLCLVVFESTRAFAEPPVELRGRYKMIEQLCVAPNKAPERIAPGFPGGHEEWVLNFSSDRNYSFSAIYEGIMGDDCQIESEGRYRLSENANATLSSVRLTPNPNSLRSSGTFPVPCQVLTTVKSVLYEARMESATGGTPVRNLAPRLRLRAEDIFGRCDHSRAKMEILFEPLDLGASAIGRVLN